MTFSTLLFDVDGTLLDFKQSESIAFAGAFAGEGYYADDDMYSAYREISRELWDSFEKGHITQEHLVVERFRRLFTRFGWELDPAMMNDIYIHTLSLVGIPYPDTLPLLDSLRGHVQMSLVTNGIAKAQRGRIKASGIEQYFGHIFISEELGARKPDPDFFNKALSACGVTDPGKVLVIGDSLTADMKGGCDCGLKACWYNPNGHKNTCGIPVDYEIRSLMELVPIVLDNV